jgi:putative phosphoesterase
VKAARAFTVGLISDTHGLLRPEALAALEGSDHVVHAGDIGDAAILEALAAIAPVTAVRGNNDTGPWARKLRERETVELGGTRIHVIHDLAALRRDGRLDGVRVVVSGHSHVPRTVEEDGILYVNPGSAGPRRFRLPVSVGRLEIAKGAARARLLELAIARP